MPRKIIPSLLFAASCLIAATAAAAPLDKSLLAAAEKAKPAVLQDWATLVNMDSGSDDKPGLLKVGAFLEQRLKELGASVEVLPSAPSGGQIVVGSLNGSGTRKVMLMVHFDTVFVAGDAARRPFRIEGGKAYGPGVADAKGGAALMLQALAVARARGINNYKTLTVFFNPDEETGTDGSSATLARISKEQDVVLSYEPPNADSVIISTNGVSRVELKVKGLASHAGSAPEKGHNAAIELSNQIMQLKDLGDAAKGTTVNWTRLQSGDRTNIIPDQASAVADVRVGRMDELARIQADADRIILKKFVPETEVSVKVVAGRPPFSKNAGTDRLAVAAVQVYGEMGKTLQPAAMRYGTDASFAYHPGSAKPVVLDGLGIVGERLHSADEWADVDSVVPRLYLTLRLLQQLDQISPQ